MCCVSRRNARKKCMWALSNVRTVAKTRFVRTIACMKTHVKSVSKTVSVRVAAIRAPTNATSVEHALLPLPSTSNVSSVRKSYGVQDARTSMRVLSAPSASAPFARTVTRVNVLFSTSAWNVASTKNAQTATNAFAKIREQSASIVQK